MSYGKEIYDNFINYCKEINMVNWIYELEWNCDGNLLFYIQNEGEGIALLWQCECQHSAAIYVLNHSFLYKWGNKAKEKRNELNEFVKKFMEDREIPDENFNICYDKNDGKQSIRPEIVSHTNDIAGYQGCKTGIFHRLTDSKRTSDCNQNIPGYIFGIFLRRKYLRPSHNNSSDANEKEHIQTHPRNGFFHGRQFANSSPYNHKDK